MSGLEKSNEKIKATTGGEGYSQDPDSFEEDRKTLEGKKTPLEIESDELDKKALSKVEDDLNGEKKLDSSGDMNERQKEVMNKLKAWRKRWKAEDIIPDKALAEHLNTPRLDKAIEFLEHAVQKIRFAQALIRYKTKIKTSDGEGYNTAGLTWKYKEKDWVLDEGHIVPDGAPDVEFGGRQTPEPESAKKVVPAGKEEAQNRAFISDGFVESQFTSAGKEEFMIAMKKLAGGQVKEAYAYNLNIIKSQINAFIYGNNGKISKKQLVNWCAEFNKKSKSLGAKSEIIDLGKIQKLKPPEVINSGKGADFHAF